jgi:RHS repeat-associated protein
MTLTTYKKVGSTYQTLTSNTYFYEKDHLGSITKITSSTGAIIDEYAYTVFGKPYKKNTLWVHKPLTSLKSDIWNTRLYTGREYDREIWLYYLRARYYDPNLARFTSRDPIGMKDNVNLYTYVANSPVMYTDRMGLEKIILWAIWNAKSVQVNLVWRGLDIALIGWVGSHTFIEFTILDNFWNTNFYSIGGHDDEILSVHFNDPVDVRWTWKKNYQNISTPTGMSDREFATNILNESIFYNQNPKDYALFSADNWNDSEWNCHNFSTTILVRASNYSSDVLSTIQDFNPSGLNPWLWEYFAPACTE